MSENIKKRKIFFLSALMLILIASLSATGRSLEKLPDFCGQCHEMKEAQVNWKKSGASEKHGNCIMCHSGSGFIGVIEAQARGLEMIFKHFSGNIKNNIKGHVPEKFCTKCHEVEEMNHEHEVEHSINRTGKICASCHNHKKGNKFFEEV